jgi:hypothetical protein
VNADTALMPLRLLWLARRMPHRPHHWTAYTAAVAAGAVALAAVAVSDFARSDDLFDVFDH